MTHPKKTPLTSEAALGFSYFLEIVHADGRVEREGPFHNLIPTEGRNHMMGVTFKGAAAVAGWYLALYEGDYTPTAAIKASTFGALATECTAYASATRPAFTSGAVADGAIDNSAARAEFLMTAEKTIFGGAMLSSSVKGAATGICMSAVRFASPKVLEVGATLRLLAGNSLISA